MHRILGFQKMAEIRTGQLMDEAAGNSTCSVTGCTCSTNSNTGCVGTGDTPTLPPF